MKLQTGLTQEQNLQLNITQELLQAISLLQYTSLELASFLEEKAEENPLLNVDIHFFRTTDPHAKKWNRYRNYEKSGPPVADIEQIPFPGFCSLADYLKTQSLLLPLDGEERKALDYFILNLDGNGYLSVDVEEACRQIGVSKEAGERALAALQRLDPPGVGARSLQECLLLQLERSPGDNALAITVIKDYFQPFVNRKWREISRKLNVSAAEIQKVMDGVQKLNPKPGAAFLQERPHYIIPDFIVKYNDGKWEIEIAEANLIDVKLNRDYVEVFRGNPDPAMKAYFREKMQQYRWLQKSLAQRRETMMKIIGELVKLQEKFFLGEKNQLRPMTMKELAERAGVHESTVSRVVKNKYVRAPGGTFALKDLFSAKLAKNREEISAQQIKGELRAIIDREDKRRPLSDQEIAEIFQKKGISVSRRTIAKYREQIGIPSSNKRRRFGAE
jgi:RNA polymerase sigma-54 factor